MFTICVAGFKGGTGKTTTATTLAYMISKEKYKSVLLVDADGQGNASCVYGVDNEKNPGISGLMQEGIERAVPPADKYIVPSDYGVDVIPANRNLSIVNGRLQAEEEKNQVDLLSKSLSRVKSKYDFCLIDCALDPNITVINAMVAANLVLVPMKLGGYEYNAFEDLKDLSRHLYSHNPRMETKIMIADFKKSVTACRLEQLLREDYGAKMLKNKVRSSIFVTKCSYECAPLPFLSKKSIAVQDYRAVLDELLEVI